MKQSQCVVHAHLPGLLTHLTILSLEVNQFVGILHSVVWDCLPFWDPTANKPPVVWYGTRWATSISAVHYHFCHHYQLTSWSHSVGIQTNCCSVGRTMQLFSVHENCYYCCLSMNALMF